MHDVSLEIYSALFQPWSTSADNPGVQPHAVASLIIGERKRTFLLRVQDNYIFFRDQERNEAEWTFAIPLPFEPSPIIAKAFAATPERLVAAFEHGITESGVFGRALLVETSRYDRKPQLWIWNLCSVSVIKQMSMSRSTSFIWAGAYQTSTTQFLELPIEGLKVIVEEQIQTGQINAYDDTGDTTLWILCDDDKLIDLLHSLCQCAFSSRDSQEDEFLYNAATEYESAHLMRDEQDADDYIFTDLPLEAVKILQIISLEHTWYRVRFTDTEKYELDGTDGNLPHPYYLPEFTNLKQPIGHNLQFSVGSPNAHERIEASVKLRDWLTKRVGVVESRRLMAQLEAVSWAPSSGDSLTP